MANSTMALLHSTWLYITLPRLWLTLYLTLHNSTMVLLHYWFIHNSTMALLHSTRLYFTLPGFYITLHYYTIWLYSHTKLIYHDSTSLYLLGSTSTSTLLNPGSTSLYLTLHNSTMALLHSTSLYIISTMSLHYSTLISLIPWLYSSLVSKLTWFYITLSWLHFTLLDSTLLYHGSTSLYYRDSTLLPWLYFTVLDSTITMSTNHVYLPPLDST